MHRFPILHKCFIVMGFISHVIQYILIYPSDFPILAFLTNSRPILTHYNLRHTDYNPNYYPTNKFHCINPI